MLKHSLNNKFKKDYKRCLKRGKDIEKLWNIVELLVNEKPLEQRFRNHKLKGEYYPYWELHIEPDWLLVYDKTPDEIILLRTGTHSDLFD